MHCSSWIQGAIGLLLGAVAGCGSMVAEDPMDAESDVEVEITSAFLESIEGSTERTSMFVGIEVSNLGVAPITSMQLRSFAFADYWSRSSILVDPAGAATMLPIAPGDAVELRFFHEEEGSLFDCADWDGDDSTDVRLDFAFGEELVDVAAVGRVSCRFAE